jgi:aminopeptidase
LYNYLIMSRATVAPNSLERYAVGVVEALGVQPGQKIHAIAPATDAEDLMKAVTSVAKERGCPEVTTWFIDQRDPYKVFGEADQAQADVVNSGAATGGAMLVVRGVYLGVNGNVDASIPAQYDAAYRRSIREAGRLVMSNQVNSTIVDVPTPEWATKLFPDEEPDAQMDRLWGVLLKATQADAPDQTKALQETELRERIKRLNRLGITTLHLVDEHTDLRVGLANGHIWCGGSTMTVGNLVKTPKGKPVKFWPNGRVSCEVFTAPDPYRVDGIITNTKPFVVANVATPPGASLRLKDGKITGQPTAVEGVDLSTLNLALQREATGRLGELGLVGARSQLAGLGIETFWSEILDENNGEFHVAFGDFYPETIRGRVGGNESDEHYDFIAGNGINISASRRRGPDRTIMENGLWVYSS